MKFNDLPKYQKLAMYMQLKECIHDQFFDINEQRDMANLEKLSLVFSIPKDIDCMQKPHLKYLQKREISSLLQYLRRNGYAETNGAGLWNLTDDGICIAEDSWDYVDENDNDFGYSFWPEDYQPNEQPSAPARDSSTNDKVKSLENELNQAKQLLADREEDFARLKKYVTELESQNSKLRAKLQLSSNSHEAVLHNNAEYVELVDRAVKLVSDVMRSFK